MATQTDVQKLTHKRIAVQLGHRILVLWWWFVVRGQEVCRYSCAIRDRCYSCAPSYDEQRWSIPGGGVRAHEAPAAAARREIAEELGIMLNELRPIGVYEQVIEYKQDQVTCFQSDASTLTVYSDEAKEEYAVWCPLHTLPAERTPSVDQVLELLLS